MRKTIAFIVALLISTSAAHAAALALGTRELRFGGALDFDSAAGKEFSLNLGYGYFIADYLEVGALGEYSNNDIVTTYGLGGFAEYSIETDSAFIPYAGVQLRYLAADFDLPGSDDAQGGGTEEDQRDVSSSSSAIALGLYIGGKFFITDNMALLGRLMFEVATDDVYLDKKGPENTDLLVDFGLGYYF